MNSQEILLALQAGKISHEDAKRALMKNIKTVSSSVPEGEVGTVGSSEPIGTLKLTPCWKEKVILQQATAPDYAQQIVVLCEPDEVTKEIIESKMTGVRFLALQSEQTGIEERFQTYAIEVFEEIQRILKEKPIGKVLVQIVVSTRDEQQLFFGLSGLLKTAQLENPKLIGQLIGVDRWEDFEKMVGKLKENSQSPHENQIRYQEDKRLVSSWREVEASQKEANIPWKDQGIYLITGGAGGLGLIFAKDIAHKVKNASLILTGRSSLGEDKREKLKELEGLGVRIEYKQVDVTQKQAVADLIHSVQKQYGSLDGIIHGAGVIRDNFIIKKTKDEFLKVLAPKVTGLVNLDQASQDIGLDFFVLFSSIAGSLGNPGQVDYATANAFMDVYARYRNLLVTAKQRQGQTLSINWPLWKEGGMQIDEETEKLMMQSMGMIAMKTPTGIRALYQGLASDKDQMMVMEGAIKRLHAAFLSQTTGVEVSNPSSTVEEKKTVLVLEPKLFKEKAINYFKEQLSSIINLPKHQIEADVQLEKYGIDSLMIMQLTNQLEKTFGSLSKTLFFEYQTIQELTEYFVGSHRDRLIELLGLERKAESIESAKEYVTVAEPVQSNHSSRGCSRFASLNIKSQKESNTGDMNIAIIGLSGRYPGAANIQEFWRNLRDGKDCITEIPKERWDHSLYFNEDKNKPGKTYSKWGGFIEGVDQFDPLFFNISPREAEILDPQERLFLECVFETLEDAGYTRQSFSSRNFDLEGNVGVYVGVMYEEYQLYGAQKQALGKMSALPGNPSSIANRVSYFCNFHGPSLAVDTMCSSSLTAIHLACQSLRQGECELAIAGGVNVSIHPNKYLLLGQGKFVSSKGRCESFGLGGDGYVPGEGVGAVLLKPLSKAIVDGDNIYGIIKATAINHGGKTNGYTVPNPNAQASVIKRAFAKGGINPRKISYIEAHGTGTSLGDPIEILGLNKAFQQFTQDKQFCAIGSAKSNIGHCESAAGIAGVTKVLLQLKYHQLVPSLHSKTLNPNIDFSNTSFKVQQELEQWQRPVLEFNGESKEYPRMAGISAFGAGGSNAHVVIEEYISPQLERPQIMNTNQNPAIILLSAKNEKQLYEQVKRLLTAIGDQQFSDASLAEIAYTLQVGREAMEERLAVIVGSIKELEEKLRAFVDGQEENMEDLYRGQVKRNKEMLAIFKADEELLEAVDKWIERRKYAELLNLWVKGLIFDWDKLYGEIKPHRLSLPTYPFAKERYWAPKQESKFVSDTTVRQAAAILDNSSSYRNTSDISEQQFNLTSAQHLLQPITESNSSKRVDKQGGVLLRTLSDQLTLPSNPAGQTRQLIALSSTSISSLQPKNNEESKLVTHAQPGIPTELLQEELATSLAEALCMKRSDVDVDVSFIDMGLDSIIGVEWIQAVNKQYGTTIMATKVYDYPSIREFAGFLDKELSIQSNPPKRIQAISSLDQSPKEFSLQSIELTSIESATDLRGSTPDQIENQGRSNPLAVSFSVETLQEELATSLAEALYMKQSDVDMDANFIDMGLDSIIGVEWIQAVNKQYGITIMATKVYDYPNIREFAGFLEKELNNHHRGGLNQMSLQSISSSSLRGLIQQVQEGNLDIEEADQNLHQLYIKA